MRIDGELITREFFPDFIGNEAEINDGLCYKWAYVAARLYPNVTLWSNQSHAWVEQDGLFFDSESPNGETQLEHLNCNSRCDRDIYDSWQVSSTDELVEYWDTHGKCEFNDEEYWKRQIKNFRRRIRRREERDAMTSHPARQ